jgi:hypothetical protein
MNRKLKDKWNELVDNGLLQVTIVALGSAAIILLAIKLRWHQFPTPYTHVRDSSSRRLDAGKSSPNGCQDCSGQLHLLAFEALDEAPDVVTWPFLRYEKNAEGRSLEAVCSHPLE